MQTSMKTELVEVTPTLAKLWLEENRSNRRPRQVHVNRLARDMSEGRWKLTAEPIAFDENGRLQNGQHRLYAVIDSGVTIPMLIVHGVPEDAYDVIDQGSIRTTGDALRALGVGDADRIAAAARHVVMYDLYPDRNWNSANQDITKTQVTQFAEKNRDDLWIAASLTRQWSFGQRLASVVAGGYLILRKHDESGAFTEFSIGLQTGANLEQRSPILALRNFIMNSKHRRKDRWESQRVIIATIRAWNDYLSGTEREIYRITSTSLPMPEVK